ncbi:MAG: NnrU family protein [Rhodobacteraceae bacterium]|nr:NnrU family protein [Paracoccaceae bacterium]
MNLMIAGLVLWSAGHFFSRLAPGLRAGMDEKFGEGLSKGIMGLVLLVSIVMVIIGYRAAPVDPAYDPPLWGQHATSLLMLVAVALVGLGKTRGRVRSMMRNPMLWGAVVWSIAHLLANGDVASVVLFGGIGLWALAQIVLINTMGGKWERPAPGPISGDIKWLVITVVVYVVIIGVHVWIGPSPFGG